MDDGRLLDTPAAVIGGLTYNFLPFMVLPIYVSLEKIDVGLVDAAKDLYSTSTRAFRKVVLPLSLPGVFAGTLLTFIPAAGDFINAEYLGNPNTTMIGNSIQDQFLVQNNYPLASAMSFVLMAVITVAVLIYSKFLGTGGDRVSAVAGRRRPAGASTSTPPSALSTCSCRSSWIVCSRSTSRRPVQPRVAGVHARQLARPVQRAGAHRRLRREPQDRRHLDGDRDGARLDDRHRPRPLPVPRRPRVSTCSSSCR